MEFVIEIVVQVFGELLFQGLGEALSRRWGKLVFGILLGFGGGWLWAALVSHDTPPVIITVVVAAELLAIPALAGQRLFGKRLETRLLVEFVAVGVAFAAGRWLGYSLATGDGDPR